MITDSDIRKVYDYIQTHWDDTIRYTPEDTDLVLGMPYPYTVPCAKDERMQNYFYWDMYFTNVGLLRHGFQKTAKNNTDDLLYFLDKYGYVPNGNRTIFLNRSQPPLLSMMVKEIFQNEGDKEWLARAYQTLETEYEFWMNKRAAVKGLNRHGHHASDDELLNFYEVELAYRIPFEPKNERDKVNIADHFLSEGETGWDFSPRFDGRGADFMQVELNCFLHMLEVNNAHFCEVLDNGMSGDWIERANNRKVRFHDHFWSRERGLFLDYDFVNQRHSRIASLGTFAPLWAHIASDEQAASVVDKLSLFEHDYGISVCEKSEQKITFQWDYPNGWPPIFYVTINGLLNYGYHDDAQRIAKKYIDVVVKNFNETGELWEKYNVVNGSIKVKDEYKMPAMMGWTAGVFVYCVDLLEGK